MAKKVMAALDAHDDEPRMPEPPHELFAGQSWTPRHHATAMR
jgi:hypothetical protein